MIAGVLDRHVVAEKRFRRRDGKMVWSRINASVHRDSSGRFQHLIFVVEDISDRRTLDAQVRQTSKMDAIGRLAAGVAHDVNNLLTVIHSFTERLSEDVALGSAHGRGLADVTRAAEQAAGLTNQLLAFSRQQVLDAQPLDVNALIAASSGMLGRLVGDHIEVTTHLAAGLPRALADARQVEQVIMNLVVNARDAMPDGGTITIETTDVELENSCFHDETIVRGDYVMIAVSDTGAGMTKDVLDQMFEPFFTTKDAQHGLGLGLSTTYGIVRQSNGYIWVYSEPGVGTTFKVYLPRVRNEAHAGSPSVAQPSPSPQGTETVLLVEDEPSVRQFANRVLSDAGYRVFDAADCQEAESVFAVHGSGIALVVTDVTMPVCGGLELVSRLRARSPDVRVLYMSGYTEKSAALNAGIEESAPFLQKPFTALDLRERVRMAISDGDTRAEALSA